jgi:hypothetical protein
MRRAAESEIVLIALGVVLPDDDEQIDAEEEA